MQLFKSSSNNKVFILFILRLVVFAVLWDMYTGDMMIRSIDMRINFHNTLYLFFLAHCKHVDVNVVFIYLFKGCNSLCSSFRTKTNNIGHYVEMIQNNIT